MDNNIDIEKLRNYINDLEEKITPLTKSRPQKDVKPVKEISEEPAASPLARVQPVEEDGPKLVKKKITRTVTEKKKEQLIKAREVKKENMEKRNKLKKLESAKLLLQEEISKPKQELISSESPSEVDTEEEIIVVKKKAKPKKKPKKKIIIQEDDSTDSESDLELVEETRPRTKSFGKSHRNKKSVVKVHQHPSHNQPANYFCD
ncbi:hypothetical protein EBU95_16350 [bacterium]|nr:hypothetical protein [bacterium]